MMSHYAIWIISIFTLILLALLIFILFKFRKIRLVWIGALIGMVFYLILFLLGTILAPFQPPLIYVISILLTPTFIVGFLFWGCQSTVGSFPPCRIIAMIINTMIYVLIGALIGLLIHKFIKRKK